MSHEKTPDDDGTPFKCMDCKELVTTQTDDWPKECPHCGSIEWMTTMDAINDGPDDLNDELG